MYRKEKYVEGYRRWLQLMHYDGSSIDYGPVRLDTFLTWMEARGAGQIDQITGRKVCQFFEQLSRRKSKTTGEVLSIATLRKYLTTINRFARYLRDSGQGNIEVPVRFRGQAKKAIVVLSEPEIGRLYRACTDSLLGIRDRAMLAVFYGCGLRRNEAVHLEVSDLLPDRNLLYIRKGKGYRERYVPLVGQVRKDLIEYLTTARPVLMGKEVHEVFFVGIHGRPLGASGLYERFKKLLRMAGVEKQAGLHTLRHSIATHLLTGGMPLSRIARFLGHRSLESTQIYTHLKDGLPV
jgi:site-specific recombinase XerD